MNISDSMACQAFASIRAQYREAKARIARGALCGNIPSDAAEELASLRAIVIRYRDQLPSSERPFATIE